MNVSFIAYGLIATLSFSIAATRRISRAVKVILLIALLGIAAIATYIANTPLTLDDEKAWYATTPGREALLFLTMLSGMAARYLSRAIEERRVNLSAAATAGARRAPLYFDLWEFIYPMLFSVVSYGALLNQIQNDRLTVSVIFPRIALNIRYFTSPQIADRALLRERA